MTDMKAFWPIITGKTFLDRWSIVHLAFWFIVGANVESIRQLHPVASISLAYIAGMVGAGLWELFETKLENWGFVKHKESPLNRWVSDPLMAPVGMALGVLLIGGQ